MLGLTSIKYSALRASQVVCGKNICLQMQDSQLWSVDWEDPLEQENGNPLQYSCLKKPMDRGPWRVTVHGVAELGMT